VTVDADGVATVHLDGRPLTLSDLDAALGRRLRVVISEDAWRRLDPSREAVQRIAAGSAAAYGINTGFGHLCNTRIPPDQVSQLQHNLIVSHAVGVGEPASDAIVRLMLLLKIAGLLHGVSGVARETVACMQQMLEHDVLPIVPTQGSLGASGDLAPLAHMVLPMLGLGQVRVEGRELPATEAFTRFGIPTRSLGPKEGLALINGTQFMSAHGTAMLIRARRLLTHADVIMTMSLEGLAGSAKPFDDRLHALRPHPGAIETAANVRRLLADSEILLSHTHCDRVQDPYSLRCVPQVHGASRDAIRHVAAVVETEINAVTDNPLIFGDEVISGGAFHGQPLALTMDYLAIALAELSSISERRTYLLLSGEHGLPTLLMQNTGLNSGFMLPQYTAAALVSENKVLCHPASVDSIPTSLGQEDHVSMGATAAVKCLRVLDNVETVLAIEMLCAAQAVDYRSPLRPGVGPRLAHAEIRRHIAHAEHDRLFGEDIRTSLALLRSQAVLRAVAAGVASLH
jgi:histidine ammonia-lyase